MSAETRAIILLGKGVFGMNYRRQLIWLKMPAGFAKYRRSQIGWVVCGMEVRRVHPRLAIILEMESLL